MATDVTINEGQFVVAHVTGKDAHGHPGEFTVPPHWSADNNLLKLTPSQDGTSCRIEATLPTTGLGTSVVTTSYTPTTGPALTATVNVTLTAGPIASLEITTDPPQDLT